MLVAGQVIEVEVRTVAVFGLFCRHGIQEVLVLIPETSWVASYRSCEQLAAPGDRFVVQVLHADAATGKVSASIRAMRPDPWPLGLMDPGVRHQARVIRPVPQADRCGNGAGWLLELVPGAFVMLCGAGSSLDGVESCAVVVRASDRTQWAVEVVLIGDDPSANINPDFIRRGR